MTLVQVLKSRTVRFAIVVATLSVLQGYVFLLPIKPLYQMVVGLAIAVGIVLFRAVTEKPISEL